MKPKHLDSPEHVHQMGSHLTTIKNQDLWLCGGPVVMYRVVFKSSNKGKHGTGFDGVDCLGSEMEKPWRISVAMWKFIKSHYNLSQ